MGANNFITVGLIPAGASGLQAATDIWAAVPPTGLDPHLTFICVGEFEGIIAVEGSPDGVNFDVLCQFDAGVDADRQSGPALEFSPKIANAVVRFIRCNVKGSVKATTIVTAGGEQNCDCAGSGADGSPIITLDDNVMHDSAGGTEDIVFEEVLDSSLILQGNLAFKFAGIVHSLFNTPANHVRLRVGSVTPGSTVGSTVIANLTGAGATPIAETIFALSGGPLVKPGGAVLVQVTLQTSPPNGENDTLFVRGVVIQIQGA
jgi:hypothetical protein